MNISSTFDPVDLVALVRSNPSLVGDIRYDHAGEAGAVVIYHGILAGIRDPAIRSFATAHLTAERGHLDLRETLLQEGQRSIMHLIARHAAPEMGRLLVRAEN